MRKRLRITIKWGGMILTVLLLLAWVWSAKWSIGVHQPTAGALLNEGCIELQWREPFGLRRGSLSLSGPHRHSIRSRWWFRESAISVRALSMGSWQSSSYTSKRVSIPLWCLALLMGTFPVSLWWRDQLRGPGLCRVCAYDLRANTSGECPECGAETGSRRAAGSA